MNFIYSQEKNGKRLTACTLLLYVSLLLMHTGVVHKRRAYACKKDTWLMMMVIVKMMSTL